MSIRARLALVLLAAGALLAPPSFAQDTCGDALKVRDFGTRNKFSSPVTTVEELQALFQNSGDDIRRLLAESGFQGNPDDLFAAVRSGEGVRSQSYAPGQRLGWMFFRRSGKPVVRENLCWAGKQPFQGWEIQFTSGDNWYAMTVPEVCGNLSFLNEMPTPKCAVSVNDTAGETCENTTIQIDATGSLAQSVEVQVKAPSGRTTTLTASDARSAYRWEYDSDEPKGTFEIAVIGKSPTPRGNVLECRAEAEVTRDCCVSAEPTISLTADATRLAPGEETTVRANPRVSDCTEIDSVTIDGQQVAAPYELPFSRLDPGSYPITGQVRDGLVQTASASVTVEVVAPVAQTRDSDRYWTLRPFLGPVQTDGDSARFDFGDGERRRYASESGFGFGVEAEYHFNPRIGLGFGALLADPGIFLELDIDEAWDMTTEDTDLTVVFIGPLFHLTPERRFDLFVGPLLGWVDYSSVSWNLLGQNVRADLDGDVTLGAQVGFDLPFRADGPLGLYVGAMYFGSKAEVESPRFDLTVNPTMFQVGLSYDFGRR